MLARDMRVLCQWQRTWLLTACFPSKHREHQPVYIASLCPPGPTEVMQKRLDRRYGSSGVVLQVTDPELGDQCFLQYIVSKPALWPKGRQCLILQGCSPQTLLRNTLNKVRVRYPILGTPRETCRVEARPSGGPTSQQKHDAWPFGKHRFSETCGSFQLLTCCFKQYQKSHSLISLISSEKASCVEKLLHSQWQVHVTQISNFLLKV